jgi:hypothetical protein
VVIDYIKEYGSMVKQISESKHRQYPMIAKDDIVQELWLWFAEHPNKIIEWYYMEDKKYANKLFAKSLHNAALKFCQYEKAKTSGYEITDVFYYRREMVEELLPSIINGDWSRPDNMHDVNYDRTSRAPSEGNNLFAMQADISYAFDRIPATQQNVLIVWHMCNRNSKDLSNALNLPNEKAARMRVTRAIDAIINRLGGHHPYYDRDYPIIKKEITDVVE